MISIDAERCRHCDRCFQACPDGIIGSGPAVREPAAAYCNRCGHCYAVCPEAAISLAGFPDAASAELPAAPAISPDDMRALLERRRSMRIYQSRPVGHEHLQALIEAASWAPSSSNRRPVRAYVYADPQIVAGVSRLAADYFRGLLRWIALPGLSAIAPLLGYSRHELAGLLHVLRHITTTQDRPDPILYGAPALLLFAVPRREQEGLADAYLAAQNAVVFAETIPLGTCYSGYVVQAANHNRRLRDYLGIAPGEKIVAALGAGYPGMKYQRPAPRPALPTVWR